LCRLTTCPPKQARREETALDQPWKRRATLPGRQTMDVIKNEIILSTYAHEVVFPVLPEMNYSKIPDPSEAAPIFVLVYRFDRRMSENENAYVFAGGRIR